MNIKIYTQSKEIFDAKRPHAHQIGLLQALF